MAAAADAGATVREIEVDHATCTLDLGSLDAALSERTRLVAVGYASNAVGTVNPVAEIVRRAHAVGAWTFVDAVHYAPHGPLDVARLGTDFLACSAYKFFGPHVGILWGRAELLDSLPAYKVRPAHDRFETGTPDFEAICGAAAAVDHIASVGERFGEATAEQAEPREGGPGKATAEQSEPGAARRTLLVAGMEAIRAHETALHARLIAGLLALPRVRVWGITDPARYAEKVPTVSVTIDGVTPRDAATRLGAQGIFAWDGDFYAQGLIERLGLAEAGGLLRMGISHYTTAGEVDRLREAVEAIASAPSPAVMSRAPSTAAAG